MHTCSSSILEGLLIGSVLLLLYPSASIPPPGAEFMRSSLRGTKAGAGAGGGGGLNASGSTEAGRVAVCR